MASIDRTYRRGQYPNGSTCFYVIQHPDPCMTYEGIPQESRVIATTNTEEDARILCASPELLIWSEDVVERFSSIIRLGVDDRDSLRMLAKAVKIGRGTP